MQALEAAKDDMDLDEEELQIVIPKT